MLAGQNKKAWLNFFVHSLSIANPIGILSQLSSSLTTAMALDTAVSLSFLPLCLKIMPTVWSEGNWRQVQGKIQPERTLWPSRRSLSIFMTTNILILRLDTRKLLYWQCRHCNFEDYLVEKWHHKISLFKCHCLWSSSNLLIFFPFVLSKVAALCKLALRVDRDGGILRSILVLGQG